MILQLLSFLDASFAERESRLLRKLEWKPGKKPPNPRREIEEESQETSENILAP